MLVNIKSGEIQLLITSLQCTAATSDLHGYGDQAQKFRDLYQKLEGLNANFRQNS